MDVTAHIEALRADLAATAGIGDENAMRMADGLGRALEPALRLRVQDILSEAALELNAQLPDGHVEVRLAGRDVSLSYVEGEAAPDPVSDDEHSARITLRLPEGLKTRAESAAGAEGVSLNTWLVRATQRALDGGRRGPGRRMTGYASS
jgi:hypothetical protein